MTHSRISESNPVLWKRLVYVAMALIVLPAILLQADPARAEAGLDIDDYAGKVVLVDFWASWCGPCRRSFPWMNEMHAKYHDDGLVIVAVNVDNDPAAANRFLADYPARFDIHFDEDSALARAYDVAAMPSSFLIGRNGQVIATHLGFKVRKQNEYEAAIRAALATEE